MAFEWAFSIADQMSGALRAMDAQIHTFTTDLKSAENELGKFERAQKLQQLQTEKDPIKQQHGYLQVHRDDLNKQKAALEEQREAQNNSNLSMMAAIDTVGAVASAIGTAANVVGEVAGKVLDLGMAFVQTGLDASSFKRDSEMALEAILGTKDAADGAYASLTHMAEGTKYTRGQLVDMFKNLTAEGFNRKNAEDIIAAAADVGTVQGEGAKDALLGAIMTARAKGSFDERSLHELKGVGAATPEKFMAALAAAHHTDQATIKQMLQSGKISAAEGITELLQLVQQNTDKGGELGSMSKNVAGGDAATQIKNIKENFAALFENTDSGPIVDALSKIRELLDPTTTQGKQFQALVNHIFGDIGSAIGRIDFAKVEEGFESFIVGAGKAWEGVKEFAGGLNDSLGPAIQFITPIFEALFSSSSGGTSGLRELGQVIGYTAAAMLNMAAGGAWLVKEMMGLPSKIIGVAADLNAAGIQLVEGLWGGVKSQWGKMLEQFSSLVALLPASVKSVLGIHSPSAVMFGLGEYTAMGFTQGVEAVPQPTVGSMLPTVASPASSGIAASYRPSGGNVYYITVAPAVHVEASHAVSAEEVAKIAAEQIGIRTREEIVRYLESIGTEDGAY